MTDYIDPTSEDVAEWLYETVRTAHPMNATAPWSQIAKLQPSYAGMVAAKWDVRGTREWLARQHLRLARAVRCEREAMAAAARASLAYHTAWLGNASAGALRELERQRDVAAAMENAAIDRVSEMLRDVVWHGQAET